MHSYTFKENEGTNYYRVGGNTVPVAEAKLVLVECKPEEALFYIVHDFQDKKFDRILLYHEQVKGLGKYYKPILISETEKIAKDWKGWAYKEDVEGKVFKHFYTTNTWYNDAKIVLALPEHFSPKLLQDIVDGKLKEGDKCWVECVHKGDYDEYLGHGDKKSEVKLNPSGHITLHKLEEKKYNREEVLSILKRFALYVDADKVESPSIYRHIVGEWFNTNVK